MSCPAAPLPVEDPSEDSENDAIVADSRQSSLIAYALPQQLLKRVHDPECDVSLKLPDRARCSVQRCVSSVVSALAAGETHPTVSGSVGSAIVRAGVYGIMMRRKRSDCACNAADDIVRRADPTA